jgi:hypothetical protein
MGGFQLFMGTLNLNVPCGKDWWQKGVCMCT